ncbi:MAG: hypothetical protein U0031_02925 [Thermomicrobiales bacterium]
MIRRSFLKCAGALVPVMAWPELTRAAQATPGAEAADGLPELTITLTDTGFEVAQPLPAGRYHVIASNSGTATDSHFGLGKIPDEITDAQYRAFLQSEDGTDDLAFEDIAFVGAPDWPAPGSSVSGVIDLAPGRYLLFDPISGREPVTLTVDGDAPAAAEPAADLTVTLREMAFDLPETAFRGGAGRWKITNAGAMSHEMAILPVAPEITQESFAHLLEVLMSLPEDATPPPDLPEFVYQPVAAIGILAPGHTSWLDVDLPPGHYLAVCMLPFSTGYPHAVDGMYQVFDVT